MILQALYEHYLRKLADPQSGIAPRGFEWKPIPFVVVISHDGQFVTIEDTREGHGSEQRARKFLVPEAAKRTAGVRANLLWDNAEYALGANPRKRKDVAKRHGAFVARIESDIDRAGNAAGRRALLRFLTSRALGRLDRAKSVRGMWKELLETNANVTFRIDGSRLSVVDALRPYIRNGKQAEPVIGTCLVTGERAPIARLHAPVKGVRGAQVSGAALVSFARSAFESYGKHQNYNAPVSADAAFGYTTALNSLLDRDSRNRVHLGGTTLVFWPQRECILEEDFAALFALPSKDEPDADRRAVRKLSAFVESGGTRSDRGTRFYVLGLAPNSARMSVLLWHDGAIGDLATSLRQHFDDIQIAMSKTDRGHVALAVLLSDIADERKLDNVSPAFAAAVVRAVLNGGPYPTALLQLCIRRIRTEQAVTRFRAALLKAYLNRSRRLANTNEEEIPVSLALSNRARGYRLGRLFAVLEKIEEESANGQLATTIRHRFYVSASARPASAFPRLLKLKKHQLARIARGRRVNLERLLAEVFDGVSEVPSLLATEEQARFALGYYHQRQALFTKSEKPEGVAVFTAAEE